MQIPTSTSPQRQWPVLLYAGLPVVITAFLWATSSNQISLLQLFAALLLLWMPWAAYQQWSRGSRQDLPLFAMIALMYWVGYGIPLFWGPHGLALVTGFRMLSEEALTKALYLAVTGVVFLWVGIRFAKTWRHSPSINLDVPENPWRWWYLRFTLVASSTVSLFVFVPTSDNQWRQLIVNIEGIVPSVIFVILLRYYLRGKAIGLDKFLLAAYFLVALFRGISSGWLGSFAGLGIICVAAYVYERRKFPVLAILIMVPIVLFLQPGKAKFRERYWKQGISAGYAESYGERIGFWIEASARAWGNALSDPTGEGLKALSGETLTRISLLQQTANVIEITPSQIPYQHGWMYSYLLVTFIPRFIWTGKPSANAANGWYQLAYHLVLPTTDVGIAVGTATESYINFGWLGPLLIMFCLGVLLGMLEKVLLRARTGLLLSSVGIALLPGLLLIESQMAVYVSGLAQQIFFALLVLAPLLEMRPGKFYRPPQMFWPNDQLRN